MACHAISGRRAARANQRRHTRSRAASAASTVRPVAADLYDHYLASGPQFKGITHFIYGWLPQISALNARLIADNPEGERKLQADWLAHGKH